jgi:uncharacterized 2Fe-2S/4Fe-4S cluster protein (DUF4445 family)
VSTNTPEPDDSRSDSSRVGEALSAQLGFREWKLQPKVVKQLTGLTRENHRNLTAYTRGDEVVGFSAPSRPAVGLAVDMGCTKIAAYLLDLKTGTQLASKGMPNPQISFGEDLISRLVHANRGWAEAVNLARVAREAIAELAEKLCAQAETALHEVTDVCVVGNTAMVQLLLGLPVRHLLHAPFIARVDYDLDIAAHEIDLEFAPAAQLHVLPSIGGFVGADHVAMIMAHGLDCTDLVTIGLDIGTNTEIVLRNPANGTFVTTSVPSGPAFEGGQITDGMRAAPGAIEKVLCHGGELIFTTVGGVKPLGICGSGVVDLVAQLLNTNCINQRGCLNAGSAFVRKGSKGLELLLSPPEKSGHGREIVFTQHDISEIQLAKGAICAGIEALLETTGTNVEAIQEVAVAGAFGSYMDLRSAIGIGLLPRFPNAKYVQIGNAAGLGAQMALVSQTERRRARDIARQAVLIGLKQHTNFSRLLAKATQFPSKLTSSLLAIDAQRASNECS